MRRLAFILVPVMLAAAGLAACAPIRSVSIVASWTTGDDGATGEEAERLRRDSEAGPFLSVLDAFTKETGITYDYKGTRDVSQVLRAGVDRGRPPDVAVLPRLNDLQTYVQSDELHTLDDVLAPALADIAPQLLRLRGPQDPGERVYGLSIAVHAKSLVWYASGSPAAPSPANPPTTWAELIGLTRDIQGRGGVPWCLGMAAPPLSGWPGTDWIEDILLHRSGYAVYQSWAAGALPWRSAQVRAAWQAWGELVGSGRHTGNTLLTNFDVAGLGMFTSPPTCFLDHQASFLVRSYKQAQKPPAGLDFFPFPPFEPTAARPAREISEDVMGMFRDTPEARELIRYLAGEPARQVWREASGHLAFTLNANAYPTRYPEGLPRRIAQTLTGGTLCRDASDMMPATMTTAFQSAAMQYLDDPGLLDKLLTELDTVRTRTPKDKWLTLSCLHARR
ncbi:extracellular solute-binding protein [Micromonospora sp. RTGN7]|uniref:extracellular solute-binding protein n=1 Tax=Micromonospora sp. RTGN7 TaxID=3016526 RepID=UPI0029FF217E|nr:extracellular solute-binding protein [Micromonospora sp. RTGN7]